MHNDANVESTVADLNFIEQVNNVIENDSIVYLLIGLPYDVTIWRAQWPKVIHNTVEACKNKNAKLIFFDNVYMYGRVIGKMDEDTQVNPCSKKGEIRAKIAEYLISEIKQKNITALIARSADFYGPYALNTSIPDIMVFNNLAKGRKAQWLVNANVKHSFTFTLDCSKSLYLLAKNENAFNQIWHLPTANPALTGKEFIELAAGYFKVKPEYTVLTKLIVKFAGLFNKSIKEVYEMLYQNEYEYEFNSSKFENYFNFKPTSYQTGIQQTIQFVKESVPDK